MVQICVNCNRVFRESEEIKDVTFLCPSCFPMDVLPVLDEEEDIPSSVLEEFSRENECEEIEDYAKDETFEQISEF